MTDPLNTAATNTREALDTAASLAEHAIRDSQRLANQTLDGLSGHLESARASAGPALQGWANEASHLAQRGSDAVMHSAEQLRDQARLARDNTRDYISHQPVKAMLLAAATGAALLWLGSLIGRSSTSK